MGLITIADLDARQITYTDATQAQAAIDDASAVVRSIVSPVFDALDRGDTPDTPAVVVMVVCQMVRRVLTNPVGMSSETLGDYTYQAGTNAVATLMPTARERRVLRAAAAVYATATAQVIPTWGAGASYQQADMPNVDDTVDDLNLLA